MSPIKETSNDEERKGTFIYSVHVEKSNSMSLKSMFGGLTWGLGLNKRQEARGVHSWAVWVRLRPHLSSLSESQPVLPVVVITVGNPLMGQRSHPWLTVDFSVFPLPAWDTWGNPSFLGLIVSTVWQPKGGATGTGTLGASSLPREWLHVLHGSLTSLNCVAQLL